MFSKPARHWDVISGRARALAAGLFLMVATFAAPSAYAAPGQIDATFGTAGMVLHSVGLGPIYTGVPTQKVHRLADGSVLILNGTLTKLLPDGSVDDGFGFHGHVLPDFYVTSFGVEPDTGNIVLVGGLNSGAAPPSYQRFAAKRFTPQGSLDTSFGNQGIALLPEAGCSYKGRYTSVAFDSGKIIAAGGKACVEGNYPEDVVVSRFNADGTPDATFGTANGTVVIDVQAGSAGYVERAVAVAVVDGKIIVGGDTNYIPGFASNYVFFALRLNASGTVDTTFGNSGLTLVRSDPGTAFLYAMQIVGNKILLAGYRGQGGLIVRLNADGSVDSGFGDAGLLAQPVAIYDLVAVGGKLVVGSSNAGNYKYNVYRLNGDGTPDATFPEYVSNVDGYWVDFRLSKIFADATSVFLASTRRDFSDFLTQTITKLTGSGSLDATFGGGSGFVEYEPVGISSDRALAGALQADGKIVAFGSTNAGGGSRFAIARFHGNGSLDTSYGQGGQQQFKPDVSYRITPISMKLDAAGRAVVAGISFVGGPGPTGGDFAVARLTTNGAVDTTFGTNGSVIFDIDGGSNDRLVGMALTQSGKIVLSGHYGVRDGAPFTPVVVRLNADGSLDSTFGVGGKVHLTQLASGYAVAVAVTSDEKVIVSGAKGSGPYVLRLNADGSVDTTFGINGLSNIAGVNASYAYVKQVLLQPDGKILVTGDTGDGPGNSQYDWFVARFNTDGTQDSSFNGGTARTIDIASNCEHAADLALDANGRIVIGGDTLCGSYYALARLNQNGSTDTSFGIGGVVLTKPTANELHTFAQVLVQPDGRIVGVGVAATTSMNSPEASYFALMRFEGGGDVTQPTAVVRFDFNDDGRADILLRNTTTGENYLYPMNGTAIQAGEGYLRTVPAPWTLAGIGDFDGNGTADLLWRNTSTGENYIYFMNGTSIAAEGYIRTVPLAWSIAGVADFDGDGVADILLRNTSTGSNYLYPMNGLNIKGSEGYIRTVPAPWTIAGLADFNGDGRADILLRNPNTGENYLYPMNGTAILAGEGYVRTVPAPWSLAGYGDFDGNGTADLLWRNEDTGDNYIYFMNGATIASEGYIRTVPLAWSVASLADFDGDGKVDILLRNTSTGENYLYPMDGLTIKPTEGYVRTVPAGWSIVSK
jgi:uncharacterized delta-60 repeat protein